MIIDTDKVKNKVIPLTKAVLLLWVVVYSASTLFRTTDPVPKNLSSNASPSPSVICTRSMPYELVPEFERARSLRIQRLEEFTGKKLDYSFYNCINIEYADLSDEQAEGLFYFDEDSSLDNLKILVDTSYKEKDDLLTAILLHHEYTHVGQFVDELNNGKSLSCFDSEVDAFVQEINFLRTLNEEEFMSLIQRLDYYRKGGYRNSASAGTIGQLYELSMMNINIGKACAKKYQPGSDDYRECYFAVQRAEIEKMVKSSPVYQEQCKGEL